MRSPVVAASALGVVLCTAAFLAATRTSTVPSMLAVIPTSAGTSIEKEACTVGQFLPAMSCSKDPESAACCGGMHVAFDAQCACKCVPRGANLPRAPLLCARWAASYEAARSTARSVMLHASRAGAHARTRRRARADVLRALPGIVISHGGSTLGLLDSFIRCGFSEGVDANGDPIPPIDYVTQRLGCIDRKEW